MRYRAAFFLVSALLVAVSLLAAQGPATKKGRTPAKAQSAQVARGKELYKQQCAICHFDASGAKKVGPGLKGLSKRGKFADGKAVGDESIRVWIENGGKNMPSFKGMLSPEEIRDLVAYTKSL